MRQPAAIHRRSAYRAPAYLVPRVELTFELDEHATRIEAQLDFERDPAADRQATFDLDGVELADSRFELDGAPLTVELPEGGSGRISLKDLPERGVLTVRTRIDPAANTALEGLYLTGGTFCTQCEAEGFRRITWFPDRPDVLSRYTVTIRAERERYPVLLANGNPVAVRDLGEGRHEVVWEDPFPKPCYLFALVAGRLEALRDEFITASGRRVLLEIYSSAANLERCHWAMDCLKAAMRWDEVHYGREYDLDRFMIYVADDFNFGAMENKGLNIFNSRYLLADPQIATDADYQTIDRIVAHEYFHNWSGNRVTCRDWFQLSLKEGFTVYREQQYAAHRGSPGVLRIEEAALIQKQQFPQAEGPMAHPVRPEAYEAIDNFYTVTVYEKGAELIRMMHRMLGDEAYRRGCDLYFARHDGQAATCEDFLAAMAEASGRDLSGFARWYSQAGTPCLQVEERFEAASHSWVWHIRQEVPATAAATPTEPMTIPLAWALFDQEGQCLAESILLLEEPEQTLRWQGTAARPILSLLRGFSAPVRLDHELAVDDLLHLARHETDGYARWRAIRRLLELAFDEAGHADAAGEAMQALIRAWQGMLTDRASDPALIAHLLALPSESEFADRLRLIDPAGVTQQHGVLQAALHDALRPLMRERYLELRQELFGRPYRLDPGDIARRALSSTLLTWLNTQPEAEALECAVRLYETADNLSDRWAALKALTPHDTPTRRALWADFRERHAAGEPLLMNRWFSLWAQAPDTEAARLATLQDDPAYDPRNPNVVRALLATFAQQNWAGFHRADGSSYRYLAEQILAYDRSNPMLAARLCEAFARWPRFATAARQAQREALQVIAAEPRLSAHVAEWVSKTLQAGSAA